MERKQYLGLKTVNEKKEIQVEIDSMCKVPPSPPRAHHAPNFTFPNFSCRFLFPSCTHKAAFPRFRSQTPVFQPLPHSDSQIHVPSIPCTTVTPSCKQISGSHSFLSPLHRSSKISASKNTVSAVPTVTCPTRKSGSATGGKQLVLLSTPPTTLRPLPLPRIFTQGKSCDSGV